MGRFALCALVLGGCGRVFGLTPVELYDAAPAQDVADAVTDMPRPDGQPANCPAEYTLQLHTTASLYKLVADTATWNEAEADCADDMPTGQTHLIVLSNRAEWEALITIPATYLLDDTWLGASASKDGGINFRWVTAEDTAGFVVPATVGAAPWETDQPDGNSACGELRALSGSLHDSGCGVANNYICECDAHPEVPANFE